MPNPKRHRLDPIIDVPGVPRLNRFETIRPASTAIIVVDMQTAFVEPGELAHVAYAHTVINPINMLTARMRDAGGLVVFLRHTVADDEARAPPPWQRAQPQLEPVFSTLRNGADGHAIHRAIAVDPADLVVDKYRYSAFLPISSDLDAILRARGIDTVIITGTVTNICCESSARDAHMLGYRVFFPADASAAADDIAHNATLKTMDAYFADIRPTAALARLIDQAVA